MFETETAGERQERDDEGLDRETARKAVIECKQKTEKMQKIVSHHKVKNKT